MSTYIVCWVVKKESRESKESRRIVPEKYVDHYAVFPDHEHGRTAKKEAQKYFDNLIKQDNIYSASLTKVIESTDY